MKDFFEKWMDIIIFFTSLVVFVVVLVNFFSLESTQNDYLTYVRSSRPRTFTLLFFITVSLSVIVLFFDNIGSIWRSFKSFIKNNAIIFALVLLYVFFYRFWETWIRNHIIDPFLSHIESNLLNDSIFIIALTVCGLLLLINIIFREKRFKQQTFILSIIAMAFWAYYRFHSYPCGMNDSSYYVHLTPLYIDNTKKYFDILLVIAIYECFSYIIWKLKSPVTEGPIFDENQGLTRNLPIDNEQHDLLERDEIAKKVVDDLLVTNTIKGAFTYGIDAPWGSGKTSFINLMKNHLKSDKKPKIIIDFNPWLYATKKDLVTAFFDELSKTLKLYDTSLAKNLIDYSKLLSAFGTIETKMISSLLELAQNDNSPLQEKKQQISAAIRAIKRRVIIFIDDLDRLEADEILEMMKLIRNVSDFPYMYIIAAYDKTYVVKCLSTKMKSSATNFIEKIFEHEDILTPCSNESLRRALADEIKRKSEKTDLTDYIMKHENKPLNAISNLREVYRLSNRFSSTYDLTDGTIHEIDLLLFELFKTKYPVAFSLFEHKWHEILVPDDQLKYYELFQGDDKDGFFDFIKYLEGHQEVMGLNEFDIKTITMILSDLFEQKEGDKYTKYRIKSTEWFNRYMNLTQLKSDIPESEFDEVMKENFVEIKIKIDEWSNNKYVSLKHRLLNYDIDKNCDHVVFLILFIYGFLYASTKNKWENYDELTNIISHIKRFNENEDSTEKNRIDIMSLLKQSEDSDYLFNYVRYLYKENKWTDVSLCEDNLVDLQKWVFGKCCETYGNDIPSVLSRFASLLGKESYKIKRSDIIFKIHDKYIENLVTDMRDYAENHFLYFTQIIFDTEERSAFSRSFSRSAINPITKLIWGSWKEFKDFLIKWNERENNPQVNEFIEFFNEFEENHYKPVIRYNYEKDFIYNVVKAIMNFKPNIY